jgi:hypothetical protein
LQIKTKIVNCYTANSKPVKQEVNSSLILPPLEFPDSLLRQNASYSAKIFYNIGPWKSSPWGRQIVALGPWVKVIKLFFFVSANAAK